MELYVITTKTRIRWTGLKNEYVINNAEVAHDETMEPLYILSGVKVREEKNDRFPAGQALTDALAATHMIGYGEVKKQDVRGSWWTKNSAVLWHNPVELEGPWLEVGTPVKESLFQKNSLYGLDIDMSNAGMKVRADRISPRLTRINNPACGTRGTYLIVFRNGRFVETRMKEEQRKALFKALYKYDKMSAGYDEHVLCINRCWVHLLDIKSVRARTAEGIIFVSVDSKYRYKYNNEQIRLQFKILRENKKKKFSLEDWMQKQGISLKFFYKDGAGDYIARHKQNTDKAITYPVNKEYGYRILRY